MSTRRSIADVEQLVRRTYAEVAEGTTVSSSAPSHEVRLSPAALPSRPLARTLLASAAALVLVIGGFVVLANRGGEQPAGLDAPRRVLPARVPYDAVSVDSDAVRYLALTEVWTDLVRDRITYSSNAASVTVELDRTRTSLPDGEPAIVRGAAARRTASTLSWLGPEDALVEVSWSGDIDDETIEIFAQSMLYVDDDVWDEATGTGGFRQVVPFAGLATVRIDADVPFDIDLVGDLHVGLSLQVGPHGFSLGDVDPCRSALNDETSNLEARSIGYLVMAPGDLTSAVVRTIGADDRTIELTSLRPLADISIGGVVYEDRAPNAPLPTIECGGAS